MKKCNVLVTAASRRVALIRNFRVALQNGMGQVIAIDRDDESAALYFADKFYTVPMVSDPDYLPLIKKIVKKERIRLIIPTFDEELSRWAAHRDEFARLGVHVSISDPETIRICMDKLETFQYFVSHDIPTPRTWLPAALGRNLTFPLFIKPRVGRGSVQSFVVKNKLELDFFLKYVPDPIIQDFLPGREFTVDAFYSAGGELITFVPRYRLAIRSGVSDRGITFRHNRLTELMIDVSKKIKFSGPINLQGKIMDDRISLFEINPRFSGGIQLSTAAGPNFAKFLVREIQGEKLTPCFNQYRDHFRMISFEDSIFISRGGHLTFFSQKNPGIIPKKKAGKI